MGINWVEIFRNSFHGLKNIFGRNIFLYLLTAIVLHGSIDHREMLVQFFSRTRERAQYVYAYSQKKAPLDERKFRESILFFETLVSYVPSKALALVDLGYCYLQIQNYEKAIESYRRAIGVDPSLYIGYFDMGIISMQLRRFPDAIVFFQRAQNSLPLTLENYAGLAISALHEGKEKIVNEISAQKRRLEYDHQSIFANMALAYYHMQRYPEMLAVSLKGLAMYPQNKRLHYYAGLACYSLKDYPKAAVFFTRAIERDLRFVYAYYYRSLCFKELGNEKGAADDARMSAQLASDGVDSSMDSETFELHFYDESQGFFKVYSTYDRIGAAVP